MYFIYKAYKNNKEKKAASAETAETELPRYDRKLTDPSLDGSLEDRPPPSAIAMPEHDVPTPEMAMPAQASEDKRAARRQWIVLAITLFVDIALPLILYVSSFPITPIYHLRDLIFVLLTIPLSTVRSQKLHIHFGSASHFKYSSHRHDRWQVHHIQTVRSSGPDHCLWLCPIGYSLCDRCKPSHSNSQRLYRLLCNWFDLFALFAAHPRR